MSCLRQTALFAGAILWLAPPRRRPTFTSERGRRSKARRCIWPTWPRFTAVPPDEARQLAQIELMAVPSQGQYLTARQVREALLARGVDLRQHTISGASMIELGPGARAAVPGVFARPAVVGDDVSAYRANDPASGAIGRFLKSQVDAELPWQVQLLPGERMADEISGLRPAVGVPAAGATDVAVIQTRQRPQRGHVRPWLGKQQFVMRWTAGGKPREGLVAAEIKLPSTIVVAARDLPRGTILRPDDLAMRAAVEQDRRSRGFEFSEDAIGQEVGRPFRAGQVIDAENVESPELVRRGERVSIVVNHGGVRIRTEGRARDSGRRGDAVIVESATSRNTLQAVVTGVNEVEVGVGATAVATRRREGPSGERR